MPSQVTIPAKLTVRKGQRALAEHHNGLVRVAERLAWQRGTLRGRQDTDGFTPYNDAQPVSRPGHAFRAALGETAEGLAMLTFITSGNINGIVPTIAEEGQPARGIDAPDEAGDFPALTIPDAAFAPYGAGERALVMFRYTLRHEDFSLESAQVVAVPAPPARRGWEWHKLAGCILRSDAGSKWVPAVFFNLGFAASRTDAQTGSFQAWPWIQ